VRENGLNFISDEEWEGIESLQRWYNSEFFWTGGKINLRRFVVFPNYDVVGAKVKGIREQFSGMIAGGYSESEALSELESRGLIIVKRGGYEDGMLGSGFTRVADNEFNAFLVLDFLLKASRLAPTASFEIFDEGRFVKTRELILKNADALVDLRSTSEEDVESVKFSRKVFAVVNPDKYDGHPPFSNCVDEFNELLPYEKVRVVENWNWLGYESKADYDFNGDDFYGFDLNEKLCHVFFI